MTLYIAGKYTAKDRLREIRARIRRELGIECSSSWLDEKYENDGEATDETRRDNAVRDVCEVVLADGFVLDTLDESATGGREVELGVALVTLTPVAMVGPRRNVFHYLDVILHYDTWDEWFEDGLKMGKELGVLGAGEGIADAL